MRRPPGVLAAFAAAVLLWAARPAACAAEQALVEDEVYSFLHRVFGALTVCSAEQLARFSDHSATFQFSYTHQPPETLTRSSYLKRLRRDCQAYSTYDWDSLNWTVSVQGLAAVARSTFEWGGKDPMVGTPGPPKVRVKQSIAMRRAGEGVLITRVEQDVRELAKGGERAYLAKYSQGSLFGGAVKWYHGAIDYMKALWEKGDMRNR